MNQQLQRYFVATLGFAIVAVWSAAGFEAALVCVAAAAGCYGTAVLAQRTTAGRPRPARPRSSERPARRAPAARPRRPVYEEPRHELEPVSTAGERYGW